MSDITALEPAPDSPQAMIDAQRAENVQRLIRMAQQGHPVPDVMLLDMKLDLLVEWLVGPATRGMFDIVYERNVTSMLDRWEHESRVRELTSGIGQFDPSAA